MAKGGYKSRTANGLIRNNVACAVDCTLRSKVFVSRHPKTFFRSNFTTSCTEVKAGTLHPSHGAFHDQFPFATKCIYFHEGPSWMGSKYYFDPLFITNRFASAGGFWMLLKLKRPKPQAKVMVVKPIQQCSSFLE